MNREYHKWHSLSLGRDMELLIFGHAGARLLVFPTSMGRFWDWEDRGMHTALAEHIERGWVQMICVDSVDAESWYAKEAHPAARGRRHAQYDDYVLNEVLPFTAGRNPNPFLIATGASFGAYHAANFAFRHPHVVGRMIGLSGFYDISRWTDNYLDETIAAHNPFDFLSNEPAANHLDALRRMDIIIVIGQDDPASSNNQRLSELLWQRGIWHALRVWDGWAHDWPYWQHMIRLYIGGHD